MTCCRSVALRFDSEEVCRDVHDSFQLSEVAGVEHVVVVKVIGMTVRGNMLND